MRLDERQVLAQVEASRLAMFVVDRGRLAYANGAMAALVGWTPSALIGRPPAPDLLDEATWRRLEAGAAEPPATGPPDRRQGRPPRASGRRGGGAGDLA